MLLFVGIFELKALFIVYSLVKNRLMDKSNISEQNISYLFNILDDNETIKILQDFSIYCSILNSPKSLIYQKSIIKILKINRDAFLNYT